MSKMGTAVFLLTTGVPRGARARRKRKKELCLVSKLNREWFFDGFWFGWLDLHENHKDNICAEVTVSRP